MTRRRCSSQQQPRATNKIRSVNHDRSNAAWNIKDIKLTKLTLEFRESLGISFNQDKTGSYYKYTYTGLIIAKENIHLVLCALNDFSLSHSIQIPTSSSESTISFQITIF
jgi:hypothetical protein